MCLGKKKWLRTVKKEGEAWKVFEVKDDRLYAPFQLQFQLADAWLLNKEPNECDSNCGLEYEHGFHLYKKRRNANTLWRLLEKDFGPGGIRGCAETFRMIRVFYRGYIAEGNHQFVVKQIYIPVKTKNPSEGSKLWDVKEKEFVALTV